MSDGKESKEGDELKVDNPTPRATPAPTTAAPGAAASGAESGATPVAAESGATPVAAESGATPVAAESGATPVAAESGETPVATPVATASGETPVATPVVAPVAAESGATTAAPVAATIAATPAATSAAAPTAEPLADAEPTNGKLSLKEVVDKLPKERSGPALVPAPAAALAPAPAPAPVEANVGIPSFIKQSTILHIGSETFNLFLQKSVINQGAPGLLSMNDFVERFCRATINTKEVIEAFVKYWTVDGTYKNRSKSDPQPGSNIFRTPCAELDGNILKDAFTKYLGFIEGQSNRYGTPEVPSDIQNKWLLQKDYVKSYLAALTRPIDEKTCINGECARSSNDLYFSVLPKIFYLMYTNSKAKKPLVMSDIFKAFPDLSEDAKVYLEKLLDTKAGTVEAEPELYNLSMGIVQTFYMLPKLFPDVWGHLPSEEDIETMKKAKLDTPASIDQDLLKTIPTEFHESLQAATEAYNKKDADTFSKSLANLFRVLQTHIAKLSTAGEVADKINELTLALTKANADAAKVASDELINARKDFIIAREAAAVAASKAANDALSAAEERIKQADYAAAAANAKADQDKKAAEEALTAAEERVKAATEEELATARAEVVSANLIKDAATTAAEERVKAAELAAAEASAAAEARVAEAAATAAAATTAAEAASAEARQAAAADKLRADETVAAAEAARIAAQESEARAKADLVAARAAQEKATANTASATAKLTALTATASESLRVAEANLTQAKQEKDAALARLREAESAKNAASAEGIEKARAATEAAEARIREAMNQVSNITKDAERKVAEAEKEARRATAQEKASADARVEEARAAAAAAVTQATQAAEAALAAARSAAQEKDAALAAARVATEANKVEAEAKVARANARLVEATAEAEARVKSATEAAEARVRSAKGAEAATREEATRQVAKAAAAAEASRVALDATNRDKLAAEQDAASKAAIAAEQTAIAQTATKAAADAARRATDAETVRDEIVRVSNNTVKETKIQIYKELSTHLKDKLVEIQVAVGKLKVPTDLSKGLEDHLSDSEYTGNNYQEDTVNFIDQPSIVAFDEGLGIIHEYLKRLNDGYIPWEEALTKGGIRIGKSPIEDSIPRDLEQDDQNAILRNLSEILNNVKTGNADPIFKSSSINYLIDEFAKTIPYNPKEPFVFLRTFINEIVARINKIDKNHFDVRLRRLIFNLFKLSHEYIYVNICKGTDKEKCTRYYMLALYNLFNDIGTDKFLKSEDTILQKSLVSSYTANGLMNKIFKANTYEKNTLLRKLILLYINDASSDATESHNFWKQDTKIPSPSDTPKAFYEIKWENIRSIQYFINYLIREKGQKDISFYDRDPSIRLTTIKGGAVFTKEDTIRFKPYELSHVLAEQSVWDDMAKAYDTMSPQHKSLLGPLEPAPVEELKEPMKQFIRKNADPDALEEARDAVGLLSPAELEQCFHGSSSTADRIMTLYSAAIGNLNTEWLYPLMLSDIVETLDQE